MTTTTEARPGDPTYVGRRRSTMSLRLGDTDLSAEDAFAFPFTAEPSARRHQLTLPVTASARHKDLRVFHWSAEVFDNDKQARADLSVIATLNPHLLGGTESGDDNRKAVIHDVLGDRYHVFTPRGMDGWGAIRKTLARDGYERSVRQILPSGHAAGDPHHYGAKGIATMSFEHPRLGHIGFVPGVHYLTKGRWPGQAQQDKPGDPVDHVAANRKLGGAFADTLIAEARGHAGIAFGTADTNLILRTQLDKAVAGRPVTVCWDEVDQWPDTGHGNIDGVFTVDADKPRVKCIHADVLDDRELFLHGDHYLVRTVYRVRKLTS